MAYSVSETYLTHITGTRFYEVLVISDGDCQFVTLRRWAEMRHCRSGGGEVMVEKWASADIAHHHAAKIIRDKEKRGYGKESFGSAFGLANTNSLTSIQTLDLLKSHLNDKNFETLSECFIFDLDDSRDGRDEIIDTTLDKSSVTDHTKKYTDWGEF